MSRPHGGMQLCWRCRNAVPSEDGRQGCEWSMELKPVPGWTAEATYKAVMGMTWHITECPKFEPDKARGEWVD